VREFPHRLKIVVDKYHIAEGRQCSATSCPIAVSLRERFGDVRIIVNSPYHHSKPGIELGPAFYPYTEIVAAYVEQIDNPNVFTHPNTFTLWRRDDGDQA
jgi:hypothetical protein